MDNEQEIRVLIATVALHALLSRPDTAEVPDKTILKASMEYANALIKELKS